MWYSETHSFLKLWNLTAQYVDAITKNMRGGSNKIYCERVNVPVSIKEGQENTHTHSLLIYPSYHR